MLGACTVEPPALSYAQVFPGAAYAPYAAPGYAWNPAGSNLARQFFPVPVMLLTESMASDSRERATYNQNRVSDDLSTMQTSSNGSHRMHTAR